MAENYRILSQANAKNLASNPIHIIAGSSIIYTTDYGYNWTSATTPTISQIKDIEYGNGIFVAVDTSQGNVLYSNDGITWNSSSYISYGIQDIAYGNGTFVIVDSDSNSNLGFYSTDGITWNSIAAPQSLTYQAIAFGNNLFVALVNNSNQMARSSDGINWTFFTDGDVHDWEDIIYADGKFVAISDRGFAGKYSFDGVNWSTMNMTSSEDWSSIAYGNGVFVAVASDTSPVTTNAAYSTDGLNWVASDLPGSPSQYGLWEDVIFIDNFLGPEDQGAFFAMCRSSGNGIIYAASYDGVSWFTPAGSPPSNLIGTPLKSIYKSRESVVARTLYSVPNNTEASLSSISIINNGTSSGEYYLGVVKASDAATPGISTTQTIIPTKTIAAGEIDEIVGGITLSAGDEIRIYSGSSDITAHIYGVEIS